MPNVKTDKLKKSIANSQDTDSDSEIPSNTIKTMELLISSFTETLSTCVEKLTKVMEDSLIRLGDDHRLRINEFKDQIYKLEARILQLETNNLTRLSQLEVNKVDEFPPLQDRGQSMNWASATTAGMQLNAKSFSNLSSVIHASKPATLTKITKGSNTSGSIKTVPRPTVVFVGRLDKETTASDLTDYLLDSGISSAKCTKLSSKDPKREFQSAAFMVACDEKFKDILLSHTTWPFGAEVRDWYYTK